MKINEDDDTYEFSSGRTMYAHCHIVGLSPSLSVSDGYDGSVRWPVSEYWSKHVDDDEMRARNLTADDMRELADYMIGLWQKFRATL